MMYIKLYKVFKLTKKRKLWCCMRKLGMTKKYVRLVQDMYEGSETAVTCAVGSTESFKVNVGLQQGSA